MKTRFFILNLLLVFLSTYSLPIFAQKKGETKTIFNVDMDCPSCVTKIEKNITWEKGVTDLKCDLKKKTVEVTYKTNKTNDNNLIEAFKKIGKKATVISTFSKKK